STAKQFMPNFLQSQTFVKHAAASMSSVAVIRDREMRGDRRRDFGGRGDFGGGGRDFGGRDFGRRRSRSPRRRF
ncbi:hypothetical protein ANCDUO_12358, partial [Ancylostoma duodenale]